MGHLWTHREANQSTEKQLTTWEGAQAPTPLKTKRIMTKEEISRKAWRELADEWLEIMEERGYTLEREQRRQH